MKFYLCNLNISSAAYLKLDDENRKLLMRIGDKDMECWRGQSSLGLQDSGALTSQEIKRAHTVRIPAAQRRLIRVQS